MQNNSSEFSDKYLELIKRIFTKKYKRELSYEEIVRIARNLSRFGAVCSNFDRKQKGFQPLYTI